MALDSKIHQHLIEQITVRADRNMRVIIFHGQTSVFRHKKQSGFSHRFRTKYVDQYLCRTSALHQAPAVKGFEQLYDQLVSRVGLIGDGVAVELAVLRVISHASRQALGIALNERDPAFSAHATR